MSPATFNQVLPSSWPLFTTVEIAREQFSEGTAIMVAIGGWGDTAGFDIAAATDISRKLFAHNVKSMVDATGADGKLSVLNPEMVFKSSFRCRHRLGISGVSDHSHKTQLYPVCAIGYSSIAESNVVEMARITSRSQIRQKPGRSKPIHCCSRRSALLWVLNCSSRLLYQGSLEIC